MSTLFGHASHSKLMEGSTGVAFLPYLKDDKVQLQNPPQYSDETFLKISSQHNLSNGQASCSPLFSWIRCLSKNVRDSIYLHSGNCIYDCWVKSEILSGTWIIQWPVSNENLWKMERWLVMAYDGEKSTLLLLLVPCNEILMGLCGTHTISGVWQIWRMALSGCHQYTEDR